MQSFLWQSGKGWIPTSSCNKKKRKKRKESLFLLERIYYRTFNTLNIKTFCLIILFLLSLDKYLLSTYHVPGAILVAGTYLGREVGNKQKMGMTRSSLQCSGTTLAAVYKNRLQGQSRIQLQAIVEGVQEAGGADLDQDGSSRNGVKCLHSECI